MRAKIYIEDNIKNKPNFQSSWMNIDNWKLVLEKYKSLFESFLGKNFKIYFYLKPKNINKYQILFHLFQDYVKKYYPETTWDDIKLLVCQKNDEVQFKARAKATPSINKKQTIDEYLYDGELVADI